MSDNNLKKKAISRVVNDMIKDVINKAKNTLVILILDKKTSKMLSSFLKMSDLINLGIFTVESISISRQPYPLYHAIYFISSNKKSCEAIVHDFKHSNKPKYKRAHIFFCEPIENENFNILVDKKLVQRVLSCKELNLSFYIIDKNLFDLGFQNDNLKLFKEFFNLNYYVNKISNDLYTVCLIIDLYPNIQYQKKSKNSICEKIAIKLNNNLKQFFLKKKKPRRGILLLTDRTLDPTSPLLHDYNYESMIYDLFSNLIENKNEIKIIKETSKLDDNDFLWSKYKNKHIAKVCDELSEDFDNFRKSDIGQIGSNKEFENFDDMKHILQNMESYKKSNKLFNIHINLCEEINKKFKSNNLNNIFEMEQEILSGVDINANPIDPKDLLTNFNKLKSELENNNQRNDILRILSIMMTSLEISENDFFNNAGQLSIEEKKIFTNFNQLGINFSENKKKNIFVRKDKSLENKVERKKLKKKLSEIEYNVLRVTPKIQNIIEKSANCELDLNEFPFIDDCNYPKKKTKAKSIFATNDDDSNFDCPEYIYFNIGGISHNEITAINNLINENKIPYNVIIGSTGIYNAEDYLKELQDLNNNFKLDVEDNLNDKNNNDDNNISNYNDSEIILDSKKSDNDKTNIELKIVENSYSEGMGEKI